MSPTVMPWGKHRGKALAGVPSGYLAWVLEECDNVHPYLREAITLELSRRLGLAPRAGVSPEALRDAVGGWYRANALRHHPDRGGSPEVMAALNDLHDGILAVIRGQGMAP